MPKITIYEKDDTGFQYTGDEVVVFLPGGCTILSNKDVNGCVTISGNSRVSDFISDTNESTKTRIDKVLEVAKVLSDFTYVPASEGNKAKYTATKEDSYNVAVEALSILPPALYSLSAEERLFTITVEIDTTTTDNSYEYARMLVDSGFDVVYYSGTVDESLYKNSWFYDKNTYNIKYITSGITGNISKKSNTWNVGVINAIISICNQRKDCIALADLVVDSTSSFTYQDVLAAVKDVADDDGRAALFADWGYTENSLIMPGSYFYLQSLSKSVNAGKKWDSIAGVKRGVVSSYTTPVSMKLTKYDLDENVQKLTETGSRSYNGIVNIRPYGWTIWGDRTLLKNTLGSGLKASSFLSLRALVCDIAKRCYQSAINNTFESNSDVTWMNYKTSITQLLDQMVADYKLADYKIVKLASDRAAQIKCQIRLVPIEPVEDFDIYINLENATANIEEQG